MKFKKLTKSFGRLTHYTMGDPAKKISKNGYKDTNQQYGTSYFGIEDDHMRNNPNANVHKIITNYVPRFTIRSEFDPSSIKASGIGYYKTRKTYNPVTDTREQSYLNKIPEKQGTHYPKDIMQAIHIQNVTSAVNYDDPDKIGVNGTEDQIIKSIKSGKIKSSIDPVYRLVQDTKDDSKVHTLTGLNEHRTEPSNIDNSSIRVEIPRGMYKGTKKLKRGYIKDYTDFDSNKFNTEDIPTKEAVDDIKKKLVFLGRGHGKKKRT